MKIGSRAVARGWGLLQSWAPDRALGARPDRATVPSAQMQETPGVWTQLPRGRRVAISPARSVLLRSALAALRPPRQHQLRLTQNSRSKNAQLAIVLPE